METTILILILILICILPYFIKMLIFVLDDRKKLTFKVEYVTGVDDATESWLKTQKRTCYVKVKIKNYEKEIEKIIKDKHPFFINVRDIQIYEISIIGDKKFNFDVWK